MRTGLVLVLACLSLGCVRFHRDPVTGRVDTDVESPLKKGEDWSASLTGKAAFPSVFATARAAVLGNETNVTITLTGGTAGASYPWYVHQGTCASGGPIVGDQSAYPALTIGSQGRAEATARLSVKLNEASSYHVAVHASPSDMGTIVACGNLED
ncbi:MAG TPA: hypothetical protein VKA84_24860 [Gemmatimonadaceae bacterium]|nr:hypothetical protein [Gemmatimonadaceae bacterium]